LVDTSASFTVMPLDIAEKYFIETPFIVNLKLGDGRLVEARVFIAECEIEAVSVFIVASGAHIHWSLRSFRAVRCVYKPHRDIVVVAESRSQ